MSEMVGRVAVVIAEAIDAATAQGDFAKDIARAAIAAMREPTEAMIRACDWPNTDRNSSLEDVWRVMIDAALAK